jgi:hypothetical protein
MASGESWPGRRSWRRWGIVAAVLGVALGAGLRLVWPNDIEFKLDELWTFDRVQFVGRAEPFPWFGMPTSCAVRHPGGSVWIFLLLGKLFPVTQPPDLARACQLVNIAAIVVLLAFALRAVPPGEREVWLWAAVLVSVNPLAVVLHRKIWPPSIVPLFVMLTLIGWWHRERRWGAFTWGLLGLLVGLIHPAGLFLATGFALWAVLFDRRRVRWLAWIAGSCIGIVPLVPWLIYVARAMQTHPITQRHWVHAVEGKFWLRWLTEPFGLGLQPLLGADFKDFLRYPLLGGRPTYLVAILHGLLAVAAAGLVARGIVALWQRRRNLPEVIIGRSSRTAFTQNAILLGFGLVFTATLLPIYRHYLALTFPLTFVWLARLALGPNESAYAHRRIARLSLLGVCVAEFLLAASFLSYIHANPRYYAGGEYGLPYRAQSLSTWTPHGKDPTTQDMEKPLASALNGTRCLANNVVIGPAEAVPAQPVAPADGTLVTGRVMRVVATDQVIVQTTDGREVPVYVTPQTVYQLAPQGGAFVDLRPGVDVGVYYDVRDNRFLARRIARRNH